MSRLILTFATLHQVLSAEKALRSDAAQRFRCRPTPTPPGLSEAICGMSLELLEVERCRQAVQFLKQHNLAPKGVHEL